MDDPDRGPGQAAPPRISYVQDGERGLRPFLIGALERLTGRRRLEAIYRELKSSAFDPDRFFGRALELAGIRYDVVCGDEGAIPRRGPLIFVANHPFGVVDGLMLCDLARRTRGDFRILIHALLCRDRDLEPFFMPVDFSGDRRALRGNIATKHAALRVLADGGTLLIFPGGGIATRGRAGLAPLADLPWSTFLGRLIASSGATVVPVFFHGGNSPVFHIASALSPTLRAGLLLHEARNKLGRRFAVSLGAPVRYGEVAHLRRRELTDHMHRVVWSLQAPGWQTDGGGSHQR
jgi:putative hemolysin